MRALTALHPLVMAGGVITIKHVIRDNRSRCFDSAFETAGEGGFTGHLWILNATDHESYPFPKMPGDYRSLFHELNKNECP
jgi:hypothetical protein